VIYISRKAFRAYLDKLTFFYPFMSSNENLSPSADDVKPGYRREKKKEDTEGYKKM